MAYVYIASAPEDLAFVKKLSGDLTAASVLNWYDDGQAGDETIYAHLQKATHMVAILSPHILLNEQGLAALEFARQEKLERIAIRVSPMETMPPQIQGILPLNISDDSDYPDAFQTLLDDIHLAPTEPIPELPEEILTGLYSDNLQIRKSSIEALGTFRNSEETLKELAREELNALVFRERESNLKTLIHLTIQSFDKVERDSEPSIELPSKEELVKRAVGHAVIIKDTSQYLWQSNRWHILLGAAGVLLGFLGFALGGHWAYLVPPVLVGLLLPQLNVTIRQGGQLKWDMRGALMGNLILGILIAGIASVILMVIFDDLAGTYVLASLFWGGGFGLLIGWLSALEL